MGGEEFSFDRLIALLRETAASFPDRRTGANTHYRIEDIALSAFSVFFSQSPSFLDFQRQIGRGSGLHNAASLFGVSQIPTDNQIRSVLDEVPPESLSRMFDTVVGMLDRDGRLDEFRSVGNDLLVTLDGTEYFRSENLHCSQCHVSHHGEDRIQYSHKLLSPAIVKAGKREVLALAPEFIRNSDGAEKAEGEIVAAKRWIEQWGERLSPLSVTIVGDDIYAAQPFLTLVREHELNFLCVCKPQSHKYLAECVESLRREGQIETLELNEWTGKEHRITTYHWVEDVPLRDSEDAMEVGWVEVKVFSQEKDKVVYHNSFITNHRLRTETVAEVVAGGRARWKVENEDISTLKTRGYHLEHNFGHGSRHLCETLATLNILAFLLHTLLDLFDRRYRLLRQERGRRSRFFSELGTLTGYLYFENWTALLLFMIEHLRLEDPGG